MPRTWQHQQHWPRFSLSERCCFFIYVAVDRSLCKGHRSSMTFVTSKMSACISLLSDLCVTFWLRRPDNNTTKTIMCAWLLTVMPRQWSSSITSRKQVFRPPFTQMVHFYRPSLRQHVVHAHRDIAVANPSVCLSVCLSSTGTVSIRMDISLHFIDGLVVRSIPAPLQNSKGSGCQIHEGGTLGRILQLSLFISKTVGNRPVVTMNH